MDGFSEASSNLNNTIQDQDTQIQQSLSIHIEKLTIQQRAAGMVDCGSGWTNTGSTGRGLGLTMREVESHDVERSALQLVALLMKLLS